MTPKNIPTLLILLCSSLLSGFLVSCSGSKGGGKSIPIIFSTDVANGLVDVHGGQGSCPVTFSPTPQLHDGDVAPQDLDDGFTLAMAVNLEEQGELDILGIAPVFGNATLPAEMMVARHIVHNLKGRPDIPIAPGAVAPAQQTLQPASHWYDSTLVQVGGADGAFALSCGNPGVEMMREKILASKSPVTILAIGPMTDVACLLTTHPEVAPKIAEIVVLASQLEGESLIVNGKVVNDFNFRMDPLAGLLMLEAAGEIPIRLIAFSLSGQTSQSGSRLMAFNDSTLKGPSPSTEASRKSLSWFLESSVPRNQFWSKIFGTEEGPFDQYALAAALWPELFDCREGVAWVQQCPYPAWSPAYPTDALGNPTEIPYNAPDNPCTDHGPNGSSLSQVPAQLVVSLDAATPGPLLRGEVGVDGNLPWVNATARRVTVCVDFASPEAFRTFKKKVYENTW